MVKAKGFLTSGQLEVLRWIAMLCMVIDHFYKIFLYKQVPYSLLEATFGRVAYPLFAFLVGYNLVYHCRHLQKYFFSMVAIGVVTWPVHEVSLQHLSTDPLKMNIMFTLAIGSVFAAALLRLDQNRNKKTVFDVLLASVLVLVGGFLVDYGHLGILLIPAMALAVRDRKASSWAMAGLIAMGANQFVPHYIFAIVSFAVVYRVAQNKQWSIPRFNKWVYYGFYPGHLLALHLISIYLL